MTDKNRLFSFRPGEKLLEKLDQVKAALGLSPSDAAREALEEGLDRMLQKKTRNEDRQELLKLERDRKPALLSLLHKERAGIALSRAEWNFLAQLANESYDTHFHSIEVIDRELLIANMRAFAAVISLRNAQYPQLAQSEEDRYYFGNMGFSWVNREESGNDLIKHVELSINGLPELPSVGSGVFPSRNLDVALRDEPALDVNRLNGMLRPYLRSLLLVALRGYWHHNKKPLITSDDATELKWLLGESCSVSPYDFQPISNEHFAINPHFSDAAISVGIEAKRHPFVFALNSFVEITEFISLLNRVEGEKKHSYMPGIALSFVGSYSKSEPARYMLGDGRWRIFFEQSEIEAMKGLLFEFVKNPVIQAHLQRVEMIYGRI